MDKLIYTAMTGASHVLSRQAVVSQNLSNTNTPGYRSSISSFRAVPLVGQGLPTRTFVVNSITGYDFTPADVQQTGRPLDVAVNGKGWLAVQMPDGSEAYTRDGSLQISPEGILQTRSGLPVAGDGGPIAIPQNVNLTIGTDGTLSSIPSGATPSQLTVIGRLKLVNPPENQLVRGDDGLFRLSSGKPAAADPNVTVIDGSLEGSNANAVESMVDMISLARQFEMQMNMLKTASDDAQQASQILNVTG
jgi:flagellar basal-body rod protein FlgF